MIGIQAGGDLDPFGIQFLLHLCKSLSKASIYSLTAVCESFCKDLVTLLYFLKGALNQVLL